MMQKKEKARGFSQRVYDAASAIPQGRVTSYGALARCIGAPRCARQVGWAMRSCAAGVPWQRVVRTDGKIAQTAYPEIQRALLEAEGVTFLPDGRVDMARCAWCGEQVAMTEQT